MNTDSNTNFKQFSHLYDCILRHQIMNASFDPRIVGNLQTQPLKYRSHGLNRGGVGHNQWQLATLQLLIVHGPKIFEFLIA